jgi:pimeloyl-ACP methyl ester carboxylesterase
MKKAKKLLSLFLVILVVFTCSSIVFAAEETDVDNLISKLPDISAGNFNDIINLPDFPFADGTIVNKTKQNCPVIFIPGFTSSDVYDDINNPDTLAAFPSTDDILAIVKEAFIPGLINFAVDRDTDKLVVRVTDRVNEMFKYWFNEPTGEAKTGSGIVPEELTYASDKSRLKFSYDWRSDPVKNADELHKYIETACELSGSEQIALGCHSLGSTIALAYLTKYGNNRVSAMVFDSPACNGVALIGNILTGKVNLDADGISYFLKEILGDSEYEVLITSTVDLLKTAGVFKLFTRFADEIIEALAPAVYRETVAPLLGYWPTIWSMLPDSEVENAKAYIFGDILKGKDHSALISKIDNYNNTVRANRVKTLRSFDAQGKFAILSRYFSQTIPLKGSADLLGDTIIDTRSTSLGATTAPIGSYFSDEYLKGKDMKYISPDKTVDASTCLFPEQTWFIRGSGHFETGGVTEDYYDMFFFAEKELTCDTAELGRFTYRDPDTYTLVEDTAVPESAESITFLRSIYNFALALAETVKCFIKNIF